MLYDYSVLRLNGLRVKRNRERSRRERSGYEWGSHVFSHGFCEQVWPSSLGLIHRRESGYPDPLAATQFQGIATGSDQ